MSIPSQPPFSLSSTETALLPDVPSPAETSDPQQRRAVLERLHLDQRLPIAALDEFATDFVLELAQQTGLPALVNTLHAMVNFIDDEQQFFAGLYVPPPPAGASQAAPAASPTARTMSLDEGWCVHTIERPDKALPLPDVYKYPRWRGNRTIYRLGVKAYIGMRLVDPQTGVPFGTVCAVAPHTIPWTNDDVALVKDRALQVGAWAAKRETQALDSSPPPANRSEGVPAHGSDRAK